jgi:tRNA(fMet)-specific endonuclease VapC
MGSAVARWPLRKACGPHDMQIGGHARSEGLIIVTNNIREFSRVPGIRAENWV